MSRKRFMGDAEINVYHCIFKAPDRTPGNHEFAFGEAEKCKMAELVEELQHDSLIEVLAWCHMSTHSHLIVVHKRDAQQQLGREELRQRYQNYLRSQGASEKACRHIDLRCGNARKFAKRINNLSSFCGILEQRFAQWYNRKYSHRGNVFTPRFKSLLLNSLKAVVRCTQYVELNPVRAHMTHWAKDYRHNSYSLIRRGGNQAEILKAKLVVILRHFSDYKHEKWSDERVLSLYATELEQITDLPEQAVRGNIPKLLLSGHSWLSGASGVICIGGDEHKLYLRTSKKICELTWDKAV